MSQFSSESFLFQRAWQIVLDDASQKGLGAGAAKLTTSSGSGSS